MSVDYLRIQEILLNFAASELSVHSVMLFSGLLALFSFIMVIQRHYTNSYSRISFENIIRGQRIFFSTAFSILTLLIIFILYILSRLLFYGSFTDAILYSSSDAFSRINVNLLESMSSIELFEKFYLEIHDIVRSLINVKFGGFPSGNFLIDWDLWGKLMVFIFFGLLFAALILYSFSKGPYREH